VQSSRVLVIAHRGNSSAAPENTLPSFSSALDLGVDCVELDTLASADGVPVVFHDETLDRTTNACAIWNERDIPLVSKTLDQLRQLDAGGWFNPRFVGTPLSTLTEALEFISPRAMTMVERKAGDAAACIRAIEPAYALDRVIVQAFDWDFLADCRRLAPTLLIGALGHKDIVTSQLDETRQLGATVIGWEAEYFTATKIAAIHERGMKAWAWTVDDDELAHRLIAVGIDALISNVPARMQTIVSATSK